MNLVRPLALLVLSTVTIAAGAASDAPSADTHTPVFTPAAFASHVKVLASDAFEGRRPATVGETRTVDYVEQAFRKAGLEPGAGGSFRQQVPFVELTPHPAESLEVRGEGGRALSLKYGDQAVYWTKRVVPEVKLDRSQLVFVGYGIDDPASDWHDYAGVDMKGKTAVILVNDPGFATNDPKLFRGRTMTYFGRWTYKFEEAARQGAAGAIIVHEEAPAAYPWEVVRNGASPQIVIDTPDGGAKRSAVEGWITRDSAVRLFAAAGMDYDAMKARAAKRGFRPVPMELDVSTTVRNDIRHERSSNVIGVLPGTTRPGEYVILAAHWDHLGKGPDNGGDSIFNGAVDNATGVAGLIELARAFGEVRPRPERSVMFIAFTGEESGLLGSEYFADHPPMPLARVAGGINMDSMAVDGRTRDVVVVGYGASELDQYMKEAVAKQGRVLVPEPTPEKGYYFRSDHFNLAKKGVPMLYAKSGVDSVEHGAEWGRARQADYVRNRYHKPSDEYDPNWDLSGAMEDLQAYFDVCYRLSRETRFPQWAKDSEFRAIRERSLASAPGAAAPAGH